jgi:hypothetical protein
LFDAHSRSRSDRAVRHYNRKVDVGQAPTAGSLLRIPAGEPAFLARADQWVAMAYLVGPLHDFGRMAGELFRAAVHKQSDVTTALATLSGSCCCDVCVGSPISVMNGEFGWMLVYRAVALALIMRRSGGFDSSKRAGIRCQPV